MKNLKQHKDMETIIQTTPEETFNLELTSFEVNDLGDFLGELSNHYYDAHGYTDSIITAFNSAIKGAGDSPLAEQLRRDKDGLILLCSLLQREREMIGTVGDKAKALAKEIGL